MGSIERAETARAAKIEGQIKERYDQCRARGHTEVELKRLESSFGAMRTEYARALGAILHEATMGGRLERAGLRAPERRD
jgi:hypothetical protein